MVPHVRDHGFRHRLLEDEGDDESGKSIGDGLLDHHRPDSIPQLDEATAIEAEERLEHVREHVDVEEAVAWAQARQLLRHRQLADAWEAVYDV